MQQSHASDRTGSHGLAARSYPGSRGCICCLKAQPRLLLTMLRPRPFPANGEELPFLGDGLRLHSQHSRSFPRLRRSSTRQTGTSRACAARANRQSLPCLQKPRACTGGGTGRMRPSGNAESHWHRPDPPCVSQKCRASVYKDAERARQDSTEPPTERGSSPPVAPQFAPPLQSYLCSNGDPS